MVERKILTPADQAIVRDAIAAAERRTSGEIVTLVTRRSDDYAGISLTLSAMTAFAAQIVVALFFSALPLLDLAPVGLLAFFVANVLFDLTPLATQFVSATEKQRHVHRLAKEQFFANHLHRTADRAGILICVSLHERCVEILADTGIDDKVAPETWSFVTQALIHDLKRTSPGTALGNAVTACAALLQTHFPARHHDTNELPDDVIELP